MNRLIVSFLTVVLCLQLPTHVFGQKDELDKQLGEIIPSGRSEAFRKIAWQTDLIVARDLAKETGKPLFLWVMDGHPLGCT